MAKAIIILDDADSQAHGSLCVELAFDPPMPSSEEERANTRVPPSAIVAMRLIEHLNRMMELQSAEVQMSEEEQIQ